MDFPAVAEEGVEGVDARKKCAIINTSVINF